MIIGPLVDQVVAILLLPALTSSILYASPYPDSQWKAVFDTASRLQFGKFPNGDGSDQWPMTWASDGNMIAAWGDGIGWNGNLSRCPTDPTPGCSNMGYTRIFGDSGNPSSLGATDLVLYDDLNRKPLPLVADAGGKIYMFWNTDADNWDGNYTAVSNDNGQTWSFGPVSNSVFSGSADGVVVVGIAQFGQGYSGGFPAGLDSSQFYVYLRSNQTVYLGKVAKASIFNRSAYQYYAGNDSAGNPVWTADYGSKTAIYSDPNSGIDWYHFNISYDPGIGKFILAKGMDSRPNNVCASCDQLSMFEGDTPWGPWRTLYYGTFLGDGFWKFTYQLPQKWMSPDGLTMSMAFSGWPEYDNINFIRLTLQPRSAPPVVPSEPMGLKVI